MSTCINLLVIEDKPADFRLITRHLEKHGLAARCHCVANIEELEVAVEQGGWDAVLSDYNVPTLDFQHTLGVLQTGHPDLPLILVSGSVGEERAVELLKLGVWDFVLKDNLTRLVPAIERGMRDATEQRERRWVDAALRKSEQQHRTILQTAMDGFWMTDLQGRLLEVNETYCRMSGYSAPELLAMRISDLEANEAAHDTAAHIQKIVAQGEDRFESRQRRKDGSLFEVEVNVQYRPVEEGRLVAFLQDITARKQAEAALRQQGEELLARNVRLNRFNQAAVGRELRMIELKREVNELCGKLGEPLRYQLPRLETAAPEDQA